jgi:hypothetical protein
MNQRTFLGFAALIALAAPAVHAGPGSLQASASVDFIVHIPEVVRLALFDHPQSLRITAEDSARGEVQVAGPRILVVTNTPQGYLLQAALGAMFSEAAIEGLAVPVRITSGSAAVSMPSMVGKARPAPQSVQYRFSFPRGTAPGAYPWPLALAVTRP